MERVVCEWKRRESGECVCVCVCVGGWWGVGWGGKGYNRSHWNVEMCVYKRPVNSCLKQHNTPAWLGKYSSKMEKKKKSRECPRIFWNDTTLMVSFFPVASWIQFSAVQSLLCSLFYPAEMRGKALQREKFLLSVAKQYSGCHYSSFT